jgi:5'-3' exonuclease
MSDIDTPGKPVAVVDLSWAMYTFRHSYKNMCRFANQDGVRVMYPTGHVYGVLRVVQELAQQYRAVVLAVDSYAPHRFEALPTYKSGRHQPTGDPFEDYKIMTDLLNVLRIATSEKNVFYVKADGYEADDIIVSLLSGSDGGLKEWSAYFNDNDILQVRGKYHWFPSFHNPEADRREYITKKYGLDLDFLPVWYKVIHGDASDKVPNIVPRFPTKKLVQLCHDLAEVEDLDTAASYLASMEVSQAFKYVELANKKESGLYEVLKRNYDVVCPRLLPVSEMVLKSFSTSVGQIKELLAYYDIRDYVPGGG